MKEFDNSADFLLFLENAQINNALLGNGFSLSHPTLGNCFKFDMHKVLCKESIIPSESLTCPEKVLNKIRLAVSKKTLELYISNLKKKLIKSKNATFQELYKSYYCHKLETQYNCERFIKNFSNIFTLNYDPLLYFESLNYMVKQKDSQMVVDGFHADDYLKEDCIIKRLIEKDGCKIYYLHGSYFIIMEHKKDKKIRLRKLSFHPKNYEEAIKTVEDLFLEEALEQRIPFVILEDRTQMKENHISNSEYLKHCKKILQFTGGRLLVFGTSFENDQHIWECLKNSEYEKIYITCRKEKSEEEQKILEEIPCKIEYIKISDNVIWENNINS